MEKKYQVFISSTYTDLQEERQCAISCLLDMNCIPVGMEQFPASSLSQWDYIKKMIDMSDYYVLIVAGKYGTIDPEENISYTEKEYNYAASKNMPILTFLLNDIHKIADEKQENSDNERKKIEEFRSKLINANRLVKFYSSIDDLKSKITAAMHQVIVDTPAIGWIRADKVESLEKNRSVSFGVVTDFCSGIGNSGIGITTNLPKEAIDLLMEVALNDPLDRIDILKTSEGTFFSTKYKKLNENGFGKEVDLWDNAIDTLISTGLAYSETLDDNRKVVKPTVKGYDAAEILSHKI